MIRPSALQMAEACGLAPRLAERHPEASPAADAGTAKHAAVARAIATGEPPSDPDALWAWEWLKGQDATDVRAEVPLVLEDPRTWEAITEGTADVVATRAGIPSVIDWKFGRSENVPPAEDSLQLAAYALAAGLRAGAPAVSWQIVFPAERRSSGIVVLTQGGWIAWLDRIAAAASRPAVASPGAHCAGCYQRAVCPSWRERATTALALLPEQPTDLALTDEQAVTLALRVQAVREAADVAEEMVRAHVLAGGRCEADGRVYDRQTVAGRRSGPGVKELEAAGLGHLIKQGAPSERWGWRRSQ